AVIDPGVRAQRLAATGLPAVADAKRDVAAAPAETRPADPRLDRIDPTQLREPGHEIGQAAKQLLQALVGVLRHLGAEAAAGEVGGPVRAVFALQAQQVDAARRL